MTEPVRLRDARDASRFGGKAASLGASLHAGLPVPDGYALSHALVDRVASGDTSARAMVRSVFGSLGPRAVARSSAVGEDGDEHSFAGQHATVLGVESPEGLVEAVRAVHASARTKSAIAYRERKGIKGDPRIGVVLQPLVHAESAGVLFTVCPITGRDETVIEAAWGLGETVVQGLVTPDRYRIARDGTVTERFAGEKDLALHPANGGTEEREVEPHRVRALCLDAPALARLHALAQQCERHFGAKRDLEWAFAGGALHLLQVRAVTASSGAGAVKGQRAR